MHVDDVRTGDRHGALEGTANVPETREVFGEFTRDRGRNGQLASRERRGAQSQIIRLMQEIVIK